MKPTVHPRLHRRFQRISLAASIAVACIALLVLIGWALNLEVLKSIVPGTVAMNPGGTAICFLLASAAVILLHNEPSERQQFASRVCSGIVSLIATARLAGYVF